MSDQSIIISSLVHPCVKVKQSVVLPPEEPKERGREREMEGGGYKKQKE